MTALLGSHRLSMSASVGFNGRMAGLLGLRERRVLVEHAQDLVAV